MQPEPLLLQPQLVQLVCPQRSLPDALVLDECSSKSVLVDIFGVALFEADIVVVDGPQMAPPQQGRQVMVARGWRSHGSAALSEGERRRPVYTKETRGIGKVLDVLSRGGEGGPQ